MKTKIGVSACLIGQKCNFNGQDLLNNFIKLLEKNDKIQLVTYCPEDTIFGSPRPNLRIVGGDGYDVLDDKAQVINELGENVTNKQIEGSQKFLAHLFSENVKYVILSEGSPSCGSNVILQEENWPKGGFEKRVGIAAALLKRNKITVFGSYDEKEINIFLNSVLSDYKLDTQLLNLRDLPKLKKIFEEN